MLFTEPLRRNGDFRRLYAKGRTSSSSCIAIYCRANRAGCNRLGITVSSKVGNAVVRNRVRRRLKEAYRLNERLLKPGYDIVLVARTRAAAARFETLENEILGLFTRFGLMEPGAAPAHGGAEG